MAQRRLIDLHVHLDGSISLCSARELAVLAGVTLPASDEELASALQCPKDCKNLNEYLSRFELLGKLMQTFATLEVCTYNLCKELQEEGTIYAEIRFAPQKHCAQGLTQEEVVQAAIKGLMRSGMNAQLILCCMRDASDNIAQNKETVRLTQAYLGQGVCACDLAGAEALFPNERYLPVFEYARKLEVPYTIHAGEALGAESVKLAVEMGAYRIGHGVRSVEDPVLLSLLAEKNITLEICPTSNINTCVFDSVEAMPIMQLIKAGVPITINSDNRAVSNTSVGEELQLVIRAFELDEKQIQTLLLNAVNAAFTNEENKAQIREQLQV